MTREEQTKRRKEIAYCLRDGTQTVPEVAQRYNVSLWQVRQSAREHGICMPSMPHSGENCAFRVVAMLQSRMPLSEIARQTNTTRQYVFGVRERARSASIKDV